MYFIKLLFKIFIFLMFIGFVMKLAGFDTDTDKSAIVSNHQDADSDKKNENKNNDNKYNSSEESIRRIIISNINKKSEKNKRNIKVVELELNKVTATDYSGNIITDEDGKKCNYPIFVSLFSGEYSYEIRANRNTRLLGCSLN